ncbi:MAG: AAA family ATPase, partial [Thermodesulfobacteriota bacterium]
ARGVTEGTLAYTSGPQPALGADGKFQVNRDKVVLGRTLAEDEVDFESGFIMIPMAVPDAVASPGATHTTPGVPGPAPGTPTQPTAPGGVPTPVPGAPIAGRQSTVRLTFKAARDQIFKAFPAIANLADKSDERKVTISVQGTSSEGFDPSWLRNAVEEPLDEADIEREPEGDSQPQ